MKFYVLRYQKKSAPYRDALLSAGHIEDRHQPDVFLIDRDWFIEKSDPRIEVKQRPGAVVMCFPHSALPPWWYDGLVKMQPYTKCIFVMGEGQKRAMQIIAPDARVEVTGWSWCELREFQKPEHVKKILFAPIHPAGGKLRAEAVTANNEVSRELASLSHDYEISIRYVGSRFRQGLEGLINKFGVTKIGGVADNSTADIDAADLVIAEGSMMYLSVARGKPTIGINQHVPARPNGSLKAPTNWDKYGPDIAYPINCGSAPLNDLIRLAASGEQTQWRRDFIGDAFCPQAFAETVERIWRENARETIPA